jgi:PAS domain S-box-containing protein/diguanylate cyclase (GGDEF)-like protein
MDILIVEDSETQAKQLAQLLLANGYRVEVADNGHSALEAARVRKPALVVSDIAMPGMDGFEMCRALKNDPELNDVPVILLTALTSLYDVIKGLDCGADNFIRKPFESNYLLSRIQYILANRELRSAEKVQLGMQIRLGGQTHFVTAERQQIFDLLISTYEEAIQMTDELRRQQYQISRSYQALEGLYKIAEALNPAITEKAVSELALERSLDLPGIIGGFIQLLDGGGKLYTAAMHNVGGVLQPDNTCPECQCFNKVLRGELRSSELVENCMLLAAVQADSTSHVSVPLMAGSRTLGVINLISAPEAVFSNEDLQVLDTVGSQIAIALERANLYAKMENLVAERTEALEAERNRLSTVLNTSGALIILLDPQGRIAAFNPACERHLGWHAVEVVGKEFSELFLSPDRSAAARAFFENLHPAGLTSQSQQEWLARDGSVRSIIWSSSMIKRADGSIEYLLGTGIDVTELRLAEGKVEYLSNFDALTGLPNRSLLRDQMQIAMEKARNGKSMVGLFVIRFERLALVRESFGADAESDLFIQASRRLRDWAEEKQDDVGRFADDAFAVILQRHEENELSAAARQLLALMRQPYVHAQQELHPEAGIGIAVYPNDGDGFDALAQGAEAATRRALSSNMERCEFYRPELNKAVSERFKLESALRRALDRDELLLFYQPQLDLRTGHIVGFESLIRWKHPELGMVPPNAFIGIAEETGLIVPIGEWAIRTACQQVKAWHQAGFTGLRVAVNLSARQFEQQNLPTLIRETLEENELSAEYFDLELTETLIMNDAERAIGMLNELSALGIQLSIDDFGTGYSSLAYLKRFPINVLKIDRSFIREIPGNHNDAAIADAIISMAHSLGIRVIAEGVETEGQCQFLSQNLCDEIQGFLFSKPLPPDEAVTLLREERRLPPHLLSP